MIRVRTTRLAGILLLAAAAASTGCTSQIVGDAARSSLATFLTTVFSQTVNSAIVN